MYACVCMCVCMHVCVYVCVCACMYVCMYACVYVCVYACMCQMLTTVLFYFHLEPHYSAERVRQYNLAEVQVCACMHVILIGGNADQEVFR